MPLTHNTLMTLPLNKMIADTNGLYFKRTGPQKGTWTFRYMRHGRARTMSLGPYPVLSLAEARKKLLQNRLLLSEGYDPLEERQKDQYKKGYAKGIRFSDVAKECIETRKSSWTNKKHAFDWYSSLKRMAFPILDKKPLAAIDEDDITALLTPLWQTKRETAKKLQGRIKIVFAFAKFKKLYHHPNPALWQDHLSIYFGGLRNTHRINHLRSLNYHLVPSFFTELQKVESMVGKLLQFSILTTVRPTEARLAQLHEFDLDKGIWNVPWQRMKARHPHTVPLSPQVIDLINAVARTHNYPYVFHGRDVDKALSNNAVLMFLKREFPHINSTVHGFRSSFRVWAAEEHPGSYELAEKCLAHQTNRRVEGAYQRSPSTEARRPLMTQWADYVSPLTP